VLVGFVSSPAAGAAKKKERHPHREFYNTRNRTRDLQEERQKLKALSYSCAFIRNFGIDIYE
jgi:hypothetical protein